MIFKSKRVEITKRYNAMEQKIHLVYTFVLFLNMFGFVSATLLNLQLSN